MILELTQRRSDITQGSLIIAYVFADSAVEHDWMWLLYAHIGVRSI